MSVQVKIGGTMTCPKCGAIVPLGGSAQPNNKRKLKKQKGIAVTIDKKIKAFKKGVEKTIVFFLRLGFIGAILYFLYYIFLQEH